jgi:DNA-binding transcriptional LysR family regulator
VKGATAQLAELRIGDLLTLLAVRRCGSMTAAARELRVTPSFVSKSVVRLEGQLKVRLLNRSARGVSLSDAALRLLPHIEEVVERAARLGQRSPDSERQLTIAAASYLIAAFLPALAEALPKERLRGLELPPPLIRAFGAENIFDLALTLGPANLPGAWSSVPIGEIRKALYGAPAVAERLGKGPVSPDALRELPFISPIYNVDGQFVTADDDCPLGYSARKLGHETQTVGVALDLAARSRQLVFAPAIAAVRHTSRGQLREIPVRGWDVREVLYLSANGDRVLSSVQRRCVSKMETVVHELGGC